MANPVEEILALAPDRPLTVGEADGAITAALESRCEIEQTERFLTVLHDRGESADEIEGCVRAMLRRAIRLPPDCTRLVDIGGTGGDNAGTFNISTCAALLIAAAGVPVIKHGNWAVTGTCGSLDMLQQLGIPLPTVPDPAWIAAELRRAGFAVAPTPLFHRFPAELNAVRRRLPFPTVFNFAGPLAHPAAVLDGQVIGVASGSLVDVLAAVLQRLGRRQASVLHGSDEAGSGLDEPSLNGSTQITTIRDRQVATVQVMPEQFGLHRAALSDLTAEDGAASAEICRRIMSGGHGPPRDVVVLMAGIALWTTGTDSSIKNAVAHAITTIDSGTALSFVNRLSCQGAAASHAW
ncbi:MAG: anthranilate phosphoribosyltransferase [Geodermatophilaceae bacterium]